MNKLHNLMSFYDYKESLRLNESLFGGISAKIAKKFKEKGTIKLMSGKTIDCAEVVKVVMEALREIQGEWSNFYKFAKDGTLIFTYNNPQCPTMYVDDKMQIVVSANFVAEHLKMNPKFVQAILMHEILHVVLNHLEREEIWLSENGLTRNAKNHMDCNIAADVEVNTTLVNCDIITRDELVNDIHGMFLDKKRDNASIYKVVPMEEILADKDAMSKLRHDNEQNQDNQNGQGEGQGEGQSGDGQGQGQGQSQGEGQGQGQSGNGQGQGQEQSGDGQGQNDDYDKDEDWDENNKNGGRGQSGQDGQDGQGKGGNSSKSNSQNSAGHGGKPGSGSGDISGISKVGDVKTTGEFGHSSKVKDILKADKSYSRDEINEITKAIEESSREYTGERMKEKKKELVKHCSNGNLRKALIDSMNQGDQFKKIWKEIMKKFLKFGHRSGDEGEPSDNYDWKNRSKLANGFYGINQLDQEKSDPQDVNIYVDVSGSMDSELIAIICKSIVIFSKEFKYSGINIVPWSSYAGDVTKIEPNEFRNIEKTVDKIIEAVEHGRHTTGGGTDMDALVNSMIKIVDQPKKKRKDDMHIIITDGEIWGNRIYESGIVSAFTKKFGAQIAKSEAKRTCWMIYDNPRLKEKLEEDVKLGTSIFLNSDIVKKQEQ